MRIVLSAAEIAKAISQYISERVGEPGSVKVPLMDLPEEIICEIEEGDES
jgi:hypothetical protein